jgi:hypothetical protein
VAPTPERDFGQAREQIDRQEWRGAVRTLDRARKGYLKQRDRSGLEHVLGLLEVVEVSDDATRAARTNLEYALKQNLRQVTRIEAGATGTAWVDPYPGLESPREHTGIHISRGIKVWIGVGVLLGVAVVAAYFVGVALLVSSQPSTLALRIRNDTKRSVVVKWCSTETCADAFDPIETYHLDPRVSAEQDLPRTDVADLFVVYDRSGNRRRCLPVRVGSTYDRLRDKNREVAVDVSEATPCPGAFVVPSSR